MRRLIALLFSCLLIAACNNDNKKDIEKGEKVQRNDRDSSDNNKEGNDGNRDKRSYSWAAKDQNKFLEDCRRESDEQFTGDKLKDFCSCMLTQAQKYYPTYIHMDKKSNEEDDRKIFESCGEYLDEDD